MPEKNIKSRIIHKHDIEANWLKATNFIPMRGEIIIYDAEIDPDGNILALPDGRTTPYVYERFKIGDGVSRVNALPFSDEFTVLPSARVMHGDDNSLLSDIINTYIFSIDYSALAFDTTEIVVNSTTSKTSVLGQAILGQMVLA